jgi:alkanesulfonate monooxygenase SsuD/methylene tetrahydromethanopterin reductase-like flavin-dependent oxidoreductase (luciferase family)
MQEPHVASATLRDLLAWEGPSLGMADAIKGEDRVRIGLVAPPTRSSVLQLEKAGVDSLWVGGHLASPRPSPEPLVWLARLAEQSEHVTIGTATLVLPWYPPPVAAKQLADIDRAARGRLVVGVGAGGEYPDDFAAAGVPIEERGTRLDESIDLLRRFWTSEPVTYSGRHFRYSALRIHPPPVRPAGPPIVVTGRRRAAMHRAALLGDGWMPYLYSPERYARSISRIRECAAEQERSLDGFLWMAYVMVSVDANPEKAQERAAQFLGTTYSQDFTEFVDRVAVAGPLEFAVERLMAFVQAGARHLVLLPCQDQMRPVPGVREAWLPDLLAGVREASARLGESYG